jgi:hypothetical protein
LKKLKSNFRENAVANQNEWFFCQGFLKARPDAERARLFDDDVGSIR